MGGTRGGPDGKTMKDRPRQWKLNLIERANPNWIDFIPRCPARNKYANSELADKWVPVASTGMTGKRLKRLPVQFAAARFGSGRRTGLVDR